MAVIALTQRFSFRSVHGEKCHGHRYFLEVSVRGLAVTEVLRTVDEKIIRKLDGHDLSSLVSPATGEVLVDWIHEQLENSQLSGKIFGVALQETRKNRFLSARSDARLI